MADKYILKGKAAIRCPDLMKWAKWLENADRTVARETIGESDINTIFLGLDHQFGKGFPVLFETMVFGGKLSDERDRYSSWDEAVAGHKAMIERVKKEQ